MAEKAKKDGAALDKKAARRAAMLVAYTVWLRGFAAQNPEATDDQRKEAWQAVKKEQLKAGKRALRVLARKGYGIQMPKPREKAKAA